MATFTAVLVQVQSGAPDVAVQKEVDEEKYFTRPNT